MLDEHVELLEAALVEQDLQPLARGEAALGVLRVDTLPSAAQAGLGASVIEHLEGGRHRSPLPDGGIGPPCTLVPLDANVGL